MTRLYLPSLPYCLLPAVATTRQGSPRVEVLTTPVSPRPPLILVQHPELFGELATANAKFLANKGWCELVVTKRGRLVINSNVGSVSHIAAQYLDYLQQLGAFIHNAACSKMFTELQVAADKAPHLSVTAHKEFLWKKAYKMCQRRHTMVLPLSAINHISGI